jgi:hypothetical protein
MHGRDKHAVGQEHPLEVVVNFAPDSEDEEWEDDDEATNEGKDGLHKSTVNDDDDDDDLPFEFDHYANRTHTEELLLEKAVPLTQGQRDQSWHWMKKFCISGMSSTPVFVNSKHTWMYIVKGADPNDGVDFTPLEMFKILMASWFSHNVSMEAMKRGQVNEDPVLNAIRGMKGLDVDDGYNCGLFCHHDRPSFAMSPDGIILFPYCAENVMSLGDL